MPKLEFTAEVKTPDNTAVLLWTNGSNTWGIYTASGSPNGVVAAGVGSKCVDRVNGDIWNKIAGTGNNGWVCFDKELSLDGTGLGSTFTLDAADAMTRIISGALPTVTTFSFANMPIGPIFTVEFVAAQTSVPVFTGVNWYGSAPTHAGRTLYEFKATTADGIQGSGIDAR